MTSLPGNNSQILSRRGEKQTSTKLLAVTVGIAAVAALTAEVSLSPQAIAVATKAKKHRSGGTSSGGGGGGVPAMNEAMMNPLDHNNRGVEYGRRGNWPQAIAEHETALNGDPENPQFKTNLSAALLKYGQVLASKKDWGNAIHKLREAMYVDPNNQDAANLLDTCVKATGKNPDAHMKMGDDLEVSGNYVEAIAEFRRGVRQEDTGIAYAALGRVLMKQGQNSPARLVEGFSMMRTAVSKSWEPTQKNDLATTFCQIGNILKEYAVTARDRGATEIALKRLANASTAYRRAAQLNPLNTDAISGLIEVSREAVAIKPSFDNHLMLGGAYLLRDDMDRAKHEYEECNKLDPTNDMLNNARKAFHFQVAISTQHIDMIPRTITVAEDQLKKNPNDALWLYIWGMGKEKQGDRESAMKAYTKALSINPQLPKLKEHMGLVETAKPGAGSAAPGAAGSTAAAGAPGAPGGAGAAAGAAAPATPAAPAVPAVSAKELEMMGAAQAKFRAGDLDGALKDCSEMLDKNSQNGEAWLLQGRVQEKKGMLDDASVSYRQAAYLKVPGADDASRQVDSSRIAKPLGEAEKQMQAADYVSASATLKEVVSLAPNLPGPHRKLADVLEKLGDAKEAERERKKAAELEKK
jgi:tetratricopeptide (TPR) repeat protein